MKNKIWLDRKIARTRNKKIEKQQTKSKSNNKGKKLLKGIVIFLIRVFIWLK